MTESETAETADSPATEAARRLRLKRRLIGLAVLFFAAFLLSWLLPRSPSSEPAVPSVTVPLDGTAASPANTAPVGASAGQAPAANAANPATPAQSSTTPPSASVISPPLPVKPESTVQPSAPSPAEPQAPVPAHTLALPTPSSPRPSAPPQSLWYVQIGSFSQRSNAQTVVDLLRKAGYRVESATVTAGGKTYDRVRLGPFSDETTARQALDRVKRQGYPQSRLTSETKNTDPR